MLWLEAGTCWSLACWENGRSSLTQYIKNRVPSVPLIEKIAAPDGPDGYILVERRRNRNTSDTIAINATKFRKNMGTSEEEKERRWRRIADWADSWVFTFQWWPPGAGQFRNCKTRCRDISYIGVFWPSHAGSWTAVQITCGWRYCWEFSESWI